MWPAHKPSCATITRRCPKDDAHGGPCSKEDALEGLACVAASSRQDHPFTRTHRTGTACVGGRLRRTGLGGAVVALASVTFGLAPVSYGGAYQLWVARS